MARLAVSHVFIKTSNRPTKSLYYLSPTILPGRIVPFFLTYSPGIQTTPTALSIVSWGPSFLLGTHISKV